MKTNGNSKCYLIKIPLQVVGRYERSEPKGRTGDDVVLSSFR